MKNCERSTKVLLNSEGYESCLVGAMGGEEGVPQEYQFLYDFFVLCVNLLEIVAFSIVCYLS